MSAKAPDGPAQGRPPAVIPAAHPRTPGPTPGPDGGPAPEPRLSELFLDLARTDRPRLTIRDIVETLGDRSFAPVMIVLAVPNAIPFIPGSSTILGLLLLFLSVRLLLGYRRVWLPDRLASWSFDRAGFARMVDRIVPWLERLERMTRPRFWPSTYRLAERVAGAIAIVLSGLIMLPIPFANGLPAIAICLLALGISERDGLWLGAGVVVGCLAAGVVAGLFLAGMTAAATIF